MRTFFLRIIFFSIVFSVTELRGQGSKILPVSDISYTYIKQLQNRGVISGLNPTSLPYTYSEISKSLSKIDRESISELELLWIKRVEERIIDSDLGFEVVQNSSLSDTKRLSELEPLNTNLYIYQFVRFNGFVTFNDFVGNGNITHSLYYDQDPDGIDSGDRLYMRSENTYFGYQNNGLSMYLGRYSHHWAPYGESSTLLSDHAQSFDHFSLGYDSKYISFESMLGELDNLNSNGNFTGIGISEGSQRRFFAGHRIDWRPFKNFQVTYFESIIYSGFNTGISLKYLNPFNLFGLESSNSPINEDANLLVGMGIWSQLNKVTIHTQFMLDDMHFLDRDEVTTFSTTASFHIAEVVSSTDVGFELEAVAYQTYNAPQPAGRYLYLGKGIATRNTDYVLGKIYSKIYLDELVNGITITPSIIYYLQGEQTINQPIVRNNQDGSLIDIILTGEVEKTLRAGINIFYNPHPNFWFELNTGYNKVDNYMNVYGDTNNRFSTIAKIGFRFGLFHSY